MITRSVLYWVSVSCLGLSAAAAQSAQVGSIPAVAAAPAGSAVCRLRDRSPATAPSGGAGRLVAICGSSGVLLGAATSYTSATNVVTGSVLVVLNRGGKARVLLVSPTAAGAGAQVDDLTRELIRLGGRAPEAGLGTLTVNASRFAIDGSVGIGGVSRRLDLTGYAAHALAAAAPAAAIAGQQ